MKFLLFILFVLAFQIASAQSHITGLWKTVDDTDDVEKSIIEIYEHNGKLHGRVARLLEAATKTHCDKCPGDLKNKPITGMVILQDLTKCETGGTNGKILDPASGKTYSCYVELIDPNTLKLRGYLGLPTFGRTQYWYRVQR